MARFIPSAPDLAEEVRRAPTLFALADAAEKAGLDDFLSLSLEGLEARLTPGFETTKTLLGLDLQGGVENLGELLRGARAGQWKAPNEVMTELREGIRSLLLEELAGAGLTWSSLEALRSWAMEANVPDVLDWSVQVLEGLPAEASSLLQLPAWEGTTVSDAILLDGGRDSRLAELFETGLRSELRRAAVRLVMGRAANARIAREQEAKVLGSWPPPGVPDGLLQAGKRLISLYEREQEGSRALLLDDVQGVTTEVGNDPLEVRVELHPSQGSALDRLQRGVVILPMKEGEASCSCSKEGASGACLHIPLGILACLSKLRDEKEPLSVELDQLMGKPAWLRTLDAIDETLLPVDRQEEAKRMVWRVYRDRAGAVALKPFVQKQRARGGWAPGTQLGWWDAAYLPESSPADSRCIKSLFPEGGAYYRSPTAPSVPHGLLALEGHPHVSLLSRPEASVVIKEERIALRAEEREEGFVELLAAVGDVVVSTEAIVAALDAHGSAGMAAILDEEQLVCTVFRVDFRAEALLRVLASSETLFPAEAVTPLLERMGGLQEVVPLQLPRSMMGTQVSPQDEVVLQVERKGGMAFRVKARVRPVEGAPALRPGEGAEIAAGIKGGTRRFARRDFEGELENARRILRSLPIENMTKAESNLEFSISGDPALDLLIALGARGDEPGLTIEWPDDQRITRSAGVGDLRVHISSKRDWFGLEGGLQVDGVELDLALAFDAARKGSRYVEAKPGLFVALADDLRASLVRVAEQVHVGRSGMELSHAAAPLIEEWIGEGVELEAVKSFGELLQKIRASKNYEPELPEGLLTELRPYQMEGFRWLARLSAWGAGGCLADDMGLGKTVQALALLLHRASLGPALVVAPTSVCGNWVREIERFAPSLRPIVYGPLSPLEREDLQPGPGDLVILSYGLLTRDAELLAAHRFATFVLDEAQAIKNPQTNRAQAARKIVADVRIALSGTPLENHLGELWSLFRTVLPGLLGSADQFRKRFSLPIERDGDRTRREALAQVLRPFLLRRTKGEVAQELPPRTEIEVSVELSAGERRLYEEARLAAAAKVQGLDGSVPPEQRRFEVLAALTRLRLCACHPRLYEKDSTLPSAKLTRLVETLHELEAEGHRALVFSQFTRHLDLAEEALREEGVRILRLDGSTPAARRQELVDAWQEGEGGAFLISLKAGGTGLNLTGADYVIHLDPWWNPAAEDQATDRAHRIGQTRPVTVLRLIARGTIEEQILSLHGEKRALIASVLDGADGGAAVDTDELLALLTAGNESRQRDDLLLDEDVDEDEELGLEPEYMGLEG